MSAPIQGDDFDDDGDDDDVDGDDNDNNGDDNIARQVRRRKRTGAL